MNSISINGKSSIGKHIRPFVSKLKAPVIAAAMALTPAAVCSAQSVNDSVNRAENTKEIKNNGARFDVTARTFQFMDGMNLSCLSAGVSKNWNDVSAYFMMMAGWNTATKRPFVGTMEYLDYRYPNQNGNFYVSAEGYRESSIDSEDYNQKITATLAKLNLSIKDLYLCFNPRLAINVNSQDVIPKFEVLTTASYQLFKKYSLYVMGCLYDVKNPSEPISWSINAGAGINF